MQKGAKIKAKMIVRNRYWHIAGGGENRELSFRKEKGERFSFRTDI
jgi:hypothetical protein